MRLLPEEVVLARGVAGAHAQRVYVSTCEEEEGRAAAGGGGRVSGPELGLSPEALRSAAEGQLL